MKISKTSLIVALLLLVIFSNAAAAKTIDVGSGYNYQTIAAGMAAATSGDTVHVHAGTYSITSSVALKSGVVLYGDGYGSTVVRSTSKSDFASESNPALFYGNGISNFEVYGFKFQGPASSVADIHDEGQTYYGGHDEYHSAVKLVNCNNVRIHDCYATLLLSDFCRCSSTSYLYIYNNIINTSGHDGAQLYKCQNTWFYNNDVHIMINCGIRISEGRGNHTISQNTFTNALSGSGWCCVQLQGSTTGVTVTKNVFTKTSDNYPCAGYSYTGSGSTIANNVGYNCPTFLNNLGSATTYNNTVYSTEYDWKAWGYGYNADTTGGGGSVIVPDTSTPYDGSTAVTLSSPANASTVTPSNGKVSLSWVSVGSTNYQVQLATDSEFTSVISSPTTSSSATRVSVDNTTTYYWKVRAYVDSTSSWGSYTAARQFTTSNTTVGQSGVYGIITDPDTNVPLPGATVTISNNTWSDSTTTDSAGYYQFDVDANSGPYYITVSAKDYQTTSYQLPTDVSDDYTSKDITLTKSQTYFAPNYVKITVTDQFLLKKYQGATIKIYVGDASDISQTLVTGSDGVAGCELDQATRYRIETTVNGVTQTDYITAIDNEYYIIFNTSATPLVPAQFYENVSINITKNEINSTAAYVNVSYFDQAHKTDTVQFVLGQTDEKGNYTILDTSSLYNGSIMTTSFIVSNYMSQAYVVKVNVVHNDFGAVTKLYAVTFGGNTSPFSNYKEISYLGVFILFIVAAQFGRQEHASGAILLCAMAWFMIGLGMFRPLGTTVNTTIIAGTTAATVYAVMAYINSTREGY